MLLLTSFFPIAFELTKVRAVLYKNFIIFTETKRVVKASVIIDASCVAGPAALETTDDHRA